MDMHQINALPNTAKEKYMAYQRLFDQPFYADFVKWAETEANEAATRALLSTKWEEFCFSRGQQLAYAKVAQLETIIENEFTAVAQQVLEAQREHDEENDESYTDDE
jgi:hypothetical protein